jgi:hypothetical protein
VRAAERGLLWALIHQPGQALPWIKTLEDEDLEGLNSSDVLHIARELADGDPAAAPNLLMERLSIGDAQRLTSIAAEPSAPVLDAESAVRSVKRMTCERRLAAVQREIDHRQALGERGPELDALLQKKLELRRRLGPETS